MDRSGVVIIAGGEEGVISSFLVPITKMTTMTYLFVGGGKVASFHDAVDRFLLKQWVRQGPPPPCKDKGGGERRWRGGDTKYNADKKILWVRDNQGGGGGQ